MASKLKLEVMVRLVDGSQLYWDAAERIELTEEQAEALRPRRSTSERPNYDTLRPLLEQVADKFKEASGRLWTRILNRLRA
jgi:hypothetical protein